MSGSRAGVEMSHTALLPPLSFCIPLVVLLLVSLSLVVLKRRSNLRPWLSRLAAPPFYLVSLPIATLTVGAEMLGGYFLLLLLILYMGLFPHILRVFPFFILPWYAFPFVFGSGLYLPVVVRFTHRILGCDVHQRFSVMADGLARESSPAFFTRCQPPPANIASLHLFRLDVLLSGGLRPPVGAPLSQGGKSSLLKDGSNEHWWNDQLSPIQFNRAHRLVPVMRRKPIPETSAFSPAFPRQARCLPCLTTQMRLSKRAGRPVSSAASRCRTIPSRRSSSVCRTDPLQAATTWVTGTRGGSSRSYVNETWFDRKFCSGD